MCLKETYKHHLYLYIYVCNAPIDRSIPAFKWRYIYIYMYICADTAVIIATIAWQGDLHDTELQDLLQQLSLSGKVLPPSEKTDKDFNKLLPLLLVRTACHESVRVYCMRTLRF